MKSLPGLHGTDFHKTVFTTCSWVSTLPTCLNVPLACNLLWPPQGRGECQEEKSLHVQGARWLISVFIDGVPDLLLPSAIDLVVLQ